MTELAGEHLVQLVILILSVIVILTKSQADYGQVNNRCAKLETEIYTQNKFLVRLERDVCRLAVDIWATEKDLAAEVEGDWDGDPPY